MREAIRLILAMGIVTSFALVCGKGIAQQEGEVKEQTSKEIVEIMQRPVKHDTLDEDYGMEDIKVFSEKRRVVSLEDERRKRLIEAMMKIVKEEQAKHEKVWLEKVAPIVGWRRNECASLGDMAVQPIVLLGDLRATEAVEFLVDHIGYVNGDKVIDQRHSSNLGGEPCLWALKKIGHTAALAIVNGGIGGNRLVWFNKYIEVISSVWDPEIALAAVNKRLKEKGLTERETVFLEMAKLYYEAKSRELTDVSLDSLVSQYMETVLWSLNPPDIKLPEKLIDIGKRYVNARVKLTKMIQEKRDEGDAEMKSCIEQVDQAEFDYVKQGVEYFKKMYQAALKKEQEKEEEKKEKTAREKT